MLNEEPEAAALASFVSRRAMKHVSLLALFGSALFLQGCGGSGGPAAAGDSRIPAPSDGKEFTLAGAIAGLNAGSSVTLSNGSETITAVTNGRFSFSTAVSSNGAYHVAIVAQPPGQVCTVFNGSGSGVSANVSNVTVTCLNKSHSLSGRIVGLVPGAEVVLANLGTDLLTLADNGTFFFSQIDTNGSYSVTVQAQPDNQICTVSNGSGSGVVEDVSNIVVMCSFETYTIAGSVSGLLAGTQFVLENNDADPLTITADGNFTFTTPIARNASYRITVADQPDGATCTVNNGTGAGVTANVTNVAVVCSTNTYAVSGTVAGLGAGSQVTLRNNGADSLTLTRNGVFSFASRVSHLGSYTVTVGTQPIGQTCSVINGHGTAVSNDVSNLVISCSVSTYSISGTLHGLPAGAQVTLLNNGADPLTLSADGAFMFSTPVVHNGGYNVIVTTPPNGMRCTIFNANGTALADDISNVNVGCFAPTVTFDSPGTYTWTVPFGVSSIQIVATGGGGGGGGNSRFFGVPYSGGSGGHGAVVTGTFPVVAGHEFAITIGAGGGAGVTSPDGCGSGGGGGGSSNVFTLDIAQRIIAGGGGGGGGCMFGSRGGDGGGSGGAGSDGAILVSGNATGGRGGRDGIGGAGGTIDCCPDGASGGDGLGGAGGAGGGNSNLPGGAGGASSGNGSGALVSYGFAGGGGGGYGGGGSGSAADNSRATGGGAGGSTGPTGSTFQPGSNGGTSALPGRNGSVVITVQ